ncbi:hypothetical protein RBH26_05730 [Natronolimnohabitans sp. A-GB9]|uniref:hypothetical protein n=1 Tax=Natronolimnohabitans sp. A-GB9 TaxID=3069757 RepID=UPI0027B5266F|nr:hypothetical protein [Natronolimnohabitans sp. A-GB9]MDQ2049979.1 hypothetical protein [Natronolimnohabitans sp. A-GB9]
MRARCPLCRREVSKNEQHWCECGQPMDTRCYDAHGDWCSVHGRDAWIGALEL